MIRIDTRIRHVALGTALTVFVALPVVADDTEIYRTDAVGAGVKPNVLFILDTSGSMDTAVQTTTPQFNPTVAYPGSCRADRIYYSTDGEVPECGDGSANSFARSSMACVAGRDALVNSGGTGSWPAVGTTLAAQFRTDDEDEEAGTTWQRIEEDNPGPVECEADDGVHGPATPPDDDLLWINDGGSGWDTVTHNLWAGRDSTYRFFTGNYVNYFYSENPGEPVTRLQIVRDVARTLTTTLDNVNLGLMRYSSDAQGGYVIEPVRDIADSRGAILDALNSFDPRDGAGRTPLSETYYEAALYLTGRTMAYGNVSAPETSADGSRTAPGSTTYKTPIEHSCQKNFVVYLTDGAPTADDDANDDIETMIGGACAADTGHESAQDNGWTPGSGICMDDLAGWMNSPTTDLADNVDNIDDVTQTAQTYMIGFGNDVSGSADYLNEIARAGGTTNAYTAQDVPTLTRALQDIFRDIQSNSATFVTPSIAVNAFNRAATSEDLFFSLFAVGTRTHWPGNLKKYSLLDGRIVDANENDAIAPNGFFAADAQSIWSAEQDGNRVLDGGVVSQLPAPGARKLYTAVSGADIYTAENALTSTNLSDLDVGAGESTTECGDACQQSVAWARGEVGGPFIGDPLHGRPGIVVYGGQTGTPDPTDTIVFLPTNDGFLHAFDGTSADNGRELWAFMPPEPLARLNVLRQNTQLPERSYGLDGDVQVLKLDKNQDGIVDPDDDRVWLFFGMRAGGDHYYALDVTDPTRPRLMWNIGPAELPGVGQTWSTPVITRVKVGAASGTGLANTDDERFVLIFGGGYHQNQETQSYSTDPRGNRIFMVEASTGNLLWFAGGPGSVGTPDLMLDAENKEMNNAIPGRITVIDTNGDLFADRMYAGDMGGRVWRFDIFNNSPRDTLVAGGILAKLGNGGMATQSDAANRRFYNAPDVSLVQIRGETPYYNIAIGSGYRGHPLSTVTEERFYSIRDAMPYAQLSQDDYDDDSKFTPILDGVLTELSPDPLQSTITNADRGWKLSLNLQGDFRGEKVLAEATTVNNTILFTTYEPVATGQVGPCYPRSINRAYALSAFSGRPVLDFDETGVVDANDLYTQLDNTSGIVGEINVALLRPTDRPNDPAPPTVCLAGLEVLNKCVSVGGTVRTFWQRSDVAGATPAPAAPE